MDHPSDFSRIRRALETFTADIDRARAQQAASEEMLAVVEYELAQVRKLLEEHRLEPAAVPAGAVVPPDEIQGKPPRDAASGRAA